MFEKVLASLTDQVTHLLRQGMIEGRWIGTLPGRDRLAEELGCSHWTVEEAMQRLANEGLLVSQGRGSRRRIELSQMVTRTRTLRVKILLYETADKKLDYLVELAHRLQESGHDVSFASRTLMGLNMDLDRIARFVGMTEADAWIVVAGSREVLEWFALQPTPAFALFGRLNQVSLPGTSPRKADALQELIDRLLDLGHRRIVMLVREERRKPTPGFVERLFLRCLEEHGILTGSFNLPDWGDGPDALRRVLDSLFQNTPPTALIIGDIRLFVPTMQHLASIRISAPRDVSLACTDYAPLFDWCSPTITHIAWDSRPVIRRVIGWANHLGRGKTDFRKSATKARLVVGGTIGPVPSGL